MAVLNEKILRSRSEHHDGLLIDLEEISLHQQNIERIECVGHICRKLKILLLQNNHIRKIENLHKLKYLQYLNLALNKLTEIDNLEACESLTKLDLTANYIYFDKFERSILNLQGLYNLEDLYLIGNPVVSEWPSYRQFAISFLPQLKQLDGQLISPTERVESSKNQTKLLSELHVLIKKHCTAARMQELADLMESSHAQTIDIRTPTSPPPPSRTISPIYNSKGEIRQCNEGKYDYKLFESSDETSAILVFEIRIPKYMETSVEFQVEPNYIRCVIRGKVTQMRIEDVEISSVSYTRKSFNKTTGWYRLEIPLMNRIPTIDLKKKSAVDNFPPPLESF